MEKLHFAILASGRGSNAQALMEHAQKNPQKFAVSCVITDQKQAGVILHAKNFDVPCFILPVDEDRKAQEQKVLNLLQERKVRWIFLAGYMRLLGPTFLKPFYDEKLKHNRIVNIHPSLLPKFPGLHGYEDSFASTEKEGGATVHFVDEGMDTGKILLQKSFPKIPGESLEQFKARGLALEHKLYVEALELIFQL